MDDSSYSFKPVQATSLLNVKDEATEESGGRDGLAATNDSTKGESDGTKLANGIYAMHNKLGVSFPVPNKFLKKDAVENPKKTEKAPFKSPSKKMSNKAAATAEQAMTKHVLPAKVKQATRISVSFVLVSAALLCAATTALRPCQHVEHGGSFVGVTWSPRLLSAA